MLATTLYSRRFFPFYTFNVVGGLDEKGEGCVFSYDAIGCFERLKYTASGTGQALVEPFLDNLVGYKNTDKKPTVSRCGTTELFADYCVSWQCCWCDQDLRGDAGACEGYLCIGWRAWHLHWRFRGHLYHPKIRNSIWAVPPEEGLGRSCCYLEWGCNVVEQLMSMVSSSITSAGATNWRKKSRICAVPRSSGTWPSDSSIPHRF